MKSWDPENSFNKLKDGIKNCYRIFSPYFRRVIRFIALPYWYLKMVNWNECNRTHFQVFNDFIYIFFKLKYYPDNYSACRLWEKDREEWTYYFGSGYDPYQRYRLSREVWPTEYRIIFDDKEVCHQFAKGMKITMPAALYVIDPRVEYKKEIRKLFKETSHKKFIIKPVRGSAGKGIDLAVRREAEVVIISKDGQHDLKNYELENRSIVQEYVIQNDEISRIFPGSVNTIRIVTFLTHSMDVMILGSYIRFGVKNSYIDNVSSGGIGVGINTEHGKLRKFGYDKLGSRYSKHPTTNVVFENFQVPKWTKIVNIAMNIQKKTPYYKCIGLDIGVGKNEIYIIEINAQPDIVALEQRNGPLLKNPMILDEFKKYDLLINKKQRNLVVQKQS